MTQYQDVNQKNIYQQYAELGKKIAEYKITLKGQKLFNNIGWKVLAQNGLWKLPIPEQHGGNGLSWKEYINAIDGLISNYFDCKLLSLVVTHAGAIYLLLRYGSNEHKKQYLPDLIQGKMIRIKFIRSSPYLISISFNKNQFIPIEVNRNILCNFINFRRMVNGMVGARYSLNFIENIKNKTQQNNIFSRLNVKELSEKIEYKIKNSQQAIYSWFIQNAFKYESLYPFKNSVYRAL